VNMDRRQELMQESLDGQLSATEQSELQQLVERSQEVAEELDQLEAVHTLLQRPPHERAPQRLASVIMARIAQMVREERLHKEQTELDEVAEAMLNVAVSTVTVATLPLLVGAAWLMLNSKSHPEAIEAVLDQVATLIVLVMDTMQVMLEQAQEAFEEDPELAMAILTLIPVTLLILVRQVLGIEDDEQDEA
jgi:hypothetical protein